MRVTGRWPFGSASQVSQWICGGSQIIEADGPRQGPFGPQPHLMFFPAEDVTIHEDTWYTSGLCGTGSHEHRGQRRVRTGGPLGGARLPRRRWHLGLLEEPTAACFRDVHVATQHIMVAQPTYEVLGKISLGIDPKTLL